MKWLKKVKAAAPKQIITGSLDPDYEEPNYQLLSAIEPLVTKEEVADLTGQIKEMHATYKKMIALHEGTGANEPATSYEAVKKALNTLVLNGFVITSLQDQAVEAITNGGYMAKVSITTVNSVAALTLKEFLDPDE